MLTRKLIGRETLLWTTTFTESNYDITKEAVDADLKSDQNKLMDVIRRTLMNTEIPTPEPARTDV